MSDLLLTAFGNLKISIFEYERHREKDGPHDNSTARSLHSYYRKEREFNHVLSLAIKETGQIPDVAGEALLFQRSHGFHARGLVKILSVHFNSQR